MASATTCRRTECGPRIAPRGPRSRSEAGVVAQAVALDVVVLVVRRHGGLVEAVAFHVVLVGDGGLVEAVSLDVVLVGDGGVVEAVALDVVLVGDGGLVEAVALDVVLVGLYGVVLVGAHGRSFRG